jgi:hypothetical protein
MSYVPPQKRGLEKPASKPETKTFVKKDEFPELAPVTKPAEVKMNFASLFKKVWKKKNKIKKLKWGTVLLTKNGVIDSLTQEERDLEEKWKDEVYQENQLRKVSERLEKSQNLRREYDPHYESPEEWSESESEPEEEEEEEVLTDEDEEDEFEPEI